MFDDADEDTVGLLAAVTAAAAQSATARLQQAESSCLVSSIDSLPFEVLALIFGHLDPKTVLTVVGGVCQRWRGVLHTPGMVPGIDLDPKFGPAVSQLGLEAGLRTRQESA